MAAETDAAIVVGTEEEDPIGHYMLKREALRAHVVAAVSTEAGLAKRFRDEYRGAAARNEQKAGDATGQADVLEERLAEDRSLRHGATLLREQYGAEQERIEGVRTAEDSPVLYQEQVGEGQEQPNRTLVRRAEYLAQRVAALDERVTEMDQASARIGAVVQGLREEADSATELARRESATADFHEATRQYYETIGLDPVFSANVLGKMDRVRRDIRLYRDGRHRTISNIIGSALRKPARVELPTAEPRPAAEGYMPTEADRAPESGSART